MEKLDNGNYEITRGELYCYLKNEADLVALAGAGVDNWSGYEGVQWKGDEDIEKEIDNIK